jgi:hypothetical protein
MYVCIIICRAEGAKTRVAANFAYLYPSLCRPPPIFCWAFGTPPRPGLAGCPRCGWQVGAPSRCERRPIIVAEPGSALGAVPCAGLGRCAHARLLSETDRPTGDSWRSTAKNNQATPFRPSNGGGGSPPACPSTGSDVGCPSFQAAATKVGQGVPDRYPNERERSQGGGGSISRVSSSVVWLAKR